MQLHKNAHCDIAFKQTKIINNTKRQTNLPNNAAQTSLPTSQPPANDGALHFFSPPTKNFISQRLAGLKSAPPQIMSRAPAVRKL